MKFKILCAIALISTTAFAADPAIPEQMMRGRSSQYQDGFRDGFREAVRMMNGGGGGNNQWSRDIRIVRAKYGSNYGSCDFTQRLGRLADGKSSYSSKPVTNGAATLRMVIKRLRRLNTTVATV